jgi:hypothetical protein
MRIVSDACALAGVGECVCLYLCVSQSCSRSQSVLFYNVIGIGCSTIENVCDMYMSYDRWRALQEAMDEKQIAREEDQSDDDYDESFAITASPGCQQPQGIKWHGIVTAIYVLTIIGTIWWLFMILGPAVGWNMTTLPWSGVWEIWRNWVWNVGYIFYHLFWTLQV